MALDPGSAPFTGGRRTALAVVRLGLELAAAREPKVESGGSKLIYDLNGEGLPYDHVTLTRIDGRWYVAE